jgi:methylenetetrahydrofolate dehydrogenase (NADP+)/methenyltetrahydrofolate cyclohydrolase
MTIIDGKKIADKILNEIRTEIADKTIEPGLAIILVGDDPSSKLYIRLKQKACEHCGAHFHKYLFDADAKEEQILETINFLNKDDETDGILVQLPLPAGFNEEKILSAISPDKDVDALNPVNQQALTTSAAKIVSPLAKSVEQLILDTNEPLADKKIVVLANHLPLFNAIKFLFPNNIVEYVSPTQPNWQKTTKAADVLIICVGRPNFINEQHIKPNAIIIDIGINKISGNKTVGDVDFDSVKNIAGWITPVPGGVGPMTIAMLLKNLLAL